VSDQQPAGDPAAEFGDVWELLDALPRGTASPALAATPVDMAAVEVASGGPPGTAAGRRARIGRWAGPLAAVAAALLAGVVAGRVTAPDPDLAILEHLPLVKHLDLLREAGSTKFLEEMHRRRYQLPVRLMVRQGPGAREEEQRQFTAEIADLAAELRVDPAGDPLPARREAVRALPVEERLELEKAVEQFMRMSATERRAVEAVARTLVDPAREDLREAAATWRQWLLSARPEDRPGVVARGTDKRLEWLDWYAAQAARPEGRGGDRPPRGPDGRPRWPRPDGEPPRDGPGFEPPPRGPSGPPSFRPNGRRPAPPEGPGETPTPPR
jgi:hypothetical protein